MWNNGRRIIVDEVEAMQHLRVQPRGSDVWSRSARVARSVRPALPPVLEPSLFQAHNVTGRTGSGGTASVYYQSGDTFSHVTTQHRHADNVGRSRTRTAPDYHIGNTGVGGASEEFYNGRVRHTSRNPFQPVRSQADQASLHGMASRFPHPKSKY